MKRTKRMMRTTALLLAAILMLSACSTTTSSPSPTGSTPSNTEPTGQPTQGGTKDPLVIYSALNEEHTEAVCKAFEEKTGIPTSCVLLGGGEILARVRAEKESATASIWWGGSCDSFISAADEGLLLNYVSDQESKLSFTDPNGYWASIYTGYVGFVANKQRCAELNIPVPTSWVDLLQPELEGEIMMASAAASSTGYVIIASILQVMGEEEGWKYLEALDKNVFQYTERGSTCIASAIAGEAAVGVCFAHDGITNQVAGYDDILDVIIPAEGTGCEIGSVAILADGPNLEAAKEFYEFALSPECQELGAQFGAYQFPSNSDAKAAEAAQPLVGVAPVVYDPVWAGVNKADIITQWQTVTGS